MPVPVDLSKLSNVVKNVLKKAVYDKLVANVNNVDISDFVLKTKYQTDKPELENKIPDESSLATKTALIAVENKISDVSTLVKKQTITQNLLKLKRNLLTIIMTNILQLQSLIL